ncbi:MAG: hypothetical protein ACKVP2_00960 [Burkholderiales bacterium]
MTIRALAVVAVFSLLSGFATAAETGFALRPTELKAQPFFDAATVATLPEKTTVEILNRQGAWMQVKTLPGGQQGWVKMLSIQLGSQDKKSRGGFLSALSLSRPRPATTATVTTGVRGFSEEDLAKAKPNPAELAKMKSFAVTSVRAVQFAEQGNLARATVGFFDEKGRPEKDSK